VNRGGRAAQGFSLLELVVVLTILGITAAAVVPALRNGTEQTRDSATAAEIVRVLALAHAAALQRSADVIVTLDPASGRFAVQVWDRSGPHPLAEGIVAIPQGATLLGAEPRLHFRFSTSGVPGSDSVIVRVNDSESIVGVTPWIGEPFVRRVAL
jgi:prepilin-type N-terminal cleavage/methylation domain-containing protein